MLFAGSAESARTLSSLFLLTVKLNYIQRPCTFVHLFVFQRNVLNLGNQKHT